MKRTFVLALLLVSTSVAAHEPRQIQCVYNSDCVDPLVCSAYACRVQCKTDRDCVNGWVCRSLRLIDVPPGTAVPSVSESQNRCVAPGSENLGRVVITPAGIALQLLPVLPSAAPVAAVPAATPQVADSRTQRTGTPVLQAPVGALNPALSVRRVHRAGGLEFQRGERDDFLYMRHEGGEWAKLGAGEITSEPAAIAAPNGEIFVFGKGEGDAIWGVRCSEGTCGDWFSLGGVLTSAPTVTMQPDGKVRVTATGTDGRPWFTSGDGHSWSGWNPQ